MTRWVAAAFVLLAAVTQPVGHALDRAPEPAPPTVTISTDAEDVSTAQIVKLTVNVTDPHRGFRSLSVDFGDGTGAQRRRNPHCSAGQSGGSTDTVLTFLHAYRHPAAYPILVQAQTGVCGQSVAHGVAGTALLVRAGAQLSNGPLAPHVTLVDGSPSDPAPRTNYLSVISRDDDGFIAHVDLSWGDGSRERLDYPMQDCFDPIVHWPSSQQTSRPLRHGYAVPGRQYTVTATVTSVGCDGADPQQHTTRLRVRAR